MHALLFSLLDVHNFNFLWEHHCNFALQINCVDFVSYCIICNLIHCALYEYLHEANTDYYYNFSLFLNEECRSLSKTVYSGRDSGQYTYVSDAHCTTSWLDHVYVVKIYRTD